MLCIDVGITERCKYGGIIFNFAVSQAGDCCIAVGPLGDIGYLLIKYD